MKKIHIALILAVSAFAAMSCNDDFLDCTPRDQITDANFWQTEEHLVSVANTFTTSLKGKDWLNMTEIMADSAPWAVNTAYRTIGAGNYTTETSQINSIWSNAYENIGRVNYFLNNYNRAVNVKEEIRERYAAEAYFYRANISRLRLLNSEGSLRLPHLPFSPGSISTTRCGRKLCQRQKGP